MLINIESSVFDAAKTSEQYTEKEYLWKVNSICCYLLLHDSHAVDFSFYKHKAL